MGHISTEITPFSQPNPPSPEENSAHVTDNGTDNGTDGAMDLESGSPETSHETDANPSSTLSQSMRSRISLIAKTVGIASRAFSYSCNPIKQLSGDAIDVAANKLESKMSEKKAISPSKRAIKTGFYLAAQAALLAANTAKLHNFSPSTLTHKPKPMNGKRV